MPSTSCALQISSITKSDSEYIKEMIISENREDLLGDDEYEESEEGDNDEANGESKMEEEKI